MSAGIAIHAGNRLEDLADRLASLLGRGADPFRPDPIVVPGRAVARWLSMRVADAAGVSMNREFLSLPGFVARVLEPLFPAPDALAKLSPERLALPLYGWLSSGDAAGRCDELDAHRAGPPLARWFLAASAAPVLVKAYWHRPETVAGWLARPEEGGWLGAAWRALDAAGAVPPPLPSPAEIEGALAGLPGGEPAEPVYLFHPGRIPGRVLDILAALGRHRFAIHLFQLRPTRHYHGDLAPKAVAARRGAVPSGEENALLASLGKVDRDLTDGLTELEERMGEPGIAWDECYREPEAPGLLGELQRAALDAVGAVRGEEREGWREDRSATVHSFHSPLREIEGLHDAVLAFLEEHPGATPSDVLVLAPDIARYAPLVEAVFSSPEEPALALPFSVADRPAMARYPAADAFLAILDLPGQRCSAPAVHDILSKAAVRSALGFGPDELDRFRGWIARAGVRWGIDAGHRERVCGAASGPETTWRAGIDRLLLGVALPADAGLEFGGIVPCDPGPSSDFPLLGRFLAAAEGLLEFCRFASEPRSAALWAERLGAVAGEFLAAPGQEDAEGVSALFGAVAELAAQDAGEPLPLDVLRRWFEAFLEAPPARAGFLRGGVTFAPLRAGRIVPRRMIALLGLDDGAFPRADRSPAFDPLADAPRPGDPSARDDDRAALLEALLSARDRLHISFCGRSVADNAPLPPAVPLGELLDEMAARLGLARAQELVVEHPLHGFSPDAFGGETGRRFRFSRADAALARALAGAPPPTAPAPEPFELALPDDDPMPLGRLVRFFSGPLSALASARLGVDLREEEATLAADEPLELDPLTRYHARARTADLLFAGRGGDPARRELLADGFLPPGAPGEIAFDRMDREMRLLLDLLDPGVRAARKQGPLPVSVRAGKRVLAGNLPGRFGGDLVDLRIGKLRGRDLVRCWIWHLALSASAPGRSFLLHGPPAGKISFGPVENAETLLGELAEIYVEGMRRPVAFHPEAARSLVHKGTAKEEDGEKRALKTMADLRREGRDPELPFIDRFFGGELPVGSEEFAEVARVVFGPLLAAAEGLA